VLLRAALRQHTMMMIRTMTLSVPPSHLISLQLEASPHLVLALRLHPPALPGLLHMSRLPRPGCLVLGSPDLLPVPR